MQMTPVITGVITVILAAHSACAQTVDDPFPSPLAANGGVIRVGYTEFASIPDVDGEPARMMQLVDEPVSRRMFLNDQTGPIYTVSYDGRVVALYLDISEARWGVGVESGSRERGVQSFALHPQFSQPGTPGFGKLYTWTDTNHTAPEPDFAPGGGDNPHDTVLLEWTAVDPTGWRYDGGGPRELMRFEQPFPNHNGGQIAFNVFTRPDDPDFGLLYVGVADGGSGGDPLHHAQDLSRGFGKLFRVDPLGSGSTNGQYGIPADNPFAGDGDPQTLGEIYAYGVRNPQRFAWDPHNGNLFLSDIGQNIVEELSLVTRGANLGWNIWEGSFRFISRQAVDLTETRRDPSVTYPLVEYGQLDALFSPQSAASGLAVYRGDEIPQIANLVLFADMPSGEIFYIEADNLPSGGQNPIRRMLLHEGGESRTALELVRAKNAEQDREPATRVDLKLALGAGGRIFLLNKHDGTVRVLVPG
jgi:hypothetical protein